jgi:hypothetical protein
LDHVTNKAFWSKHVIFDEAFFFFFFKKKYKVCFFFFFFPTKDQVTSHLPSEISAQGDAPIFLPVNLTLSPGLVTTLEPPAARSTHAPSLTPAAGNPAASLV